MDEAGFASAHVAGTSLGGWIALILGERGRARTVTAISPAGLAHARERILGRSVLLGLRWIIRNARPPEASCGTRSGARCSPGPHRPPLARRP